MVNDFIVELGKNLALDSGIKWFNSKKMIKNIFNYAVVPNINKRFGLAIPKLNDENSILTINRNITSPTLIIIDNIERLGPIAWEVIRVIQKLSISTNLIFLLSINKDKFNELCGLSTNGNEWNLEKYISIPFYNLKPNYEDLIDSYNIPKKYNKVINTILTTPGSKGFLSVREAEKILKHCKFTKNKLIKNTNKYLLLSKFKNVWNPLTTENINKSSDPENVIAKIIHSDVLNFYEKNIAVIHEINNKWVDKIMSKDLEKFSLISFVYVHPKYRFLSDEFQKYIDKLIDNLIIIKKNNVDISEINNDILKIKNIVLEIKNNVDLKEINKAINFLYTNNLNDNFSYAKLLSYDSYYINNIMEYLYTKK